MRTTLRRLHALPSIGAVLGGLLVAGAPATTAGADPVPADPPGTVALTTAPSAFPEPVGIGAVSDAATIYTSYTGRNPLRVVPRSGAAFTLAASGAVEYATGSAIIWSDGEAFGALHWYDAATGASAEALGSWYAASPTGGLFTVTGGGRTVLRNQNALTGAITTLGVVRSPAPATFPSIVAGTSGAAVLSVSRADPAATTVDYVPYTGGTVAVDLTGLTPAERQNVQCTDLAGTTLACQGVDRIIGLHTDGTPPTFVPFAGGASAVTYLRVTTTSFGWVSRVGDGVYRLATVPVTGGTPTQGPLVSSALAASDTEFAYAGETSSADAGVYRTRNAATTPRPVARLGTADYIARAIGLSPARAVWADNARTDGPLWQRTVTGPGTVTAGRSVIRTGVAGGFAFLSGIRTVFSPQFRLATAVSPVLPTTTLPESDPRGLNGHWLTTADAASSSTGPDILRDLRTGTTIDTAARFDAFPFGAVSGSRYSFLRADGSVWQVGLAGSAAPVQLLDAAPPVGGTFYSGAVVAWGDWLVVSRVYSDGHLVRVVDLLDTRAGQRQTLTGTNAVAASAAGWLSSAIDEDGFPMGPYTLHSWDGADTVTLAAQWTPAVAGGSMAWIGYDSRPRLAPVPWTVVDRPRYLGSALAPTRLTSGATWTFDAPTSARLTSCTVQLSRGAAAVRALPCDSASAADGDALVRWDGRDGSDIPVAAGVYTWKVVARNADGALLAADGSTSPVTGTVRVVAAG